MPDTNMVIEPTGIEGLDTLLGGGIPLGSVVILVGIPGSGKTILSQQISFAWLNRQAGQPANQNSPRKVLFFTTFSEPHDKLVKHLSPFNFFDASRLNQDFKILSLSGVAREGFSKVADVIIETVLREKAQLVVLDSLGSLEGEPEELKQFVYRLSGQLNALRATVLISMARAYQSSVVDADLTFADGIIGLSSRTEGVRKFRRAEVLKMRGMNHLLGLHHYTIQNSGLIFYPRIESWPDKELAFPISADRLGFGLPELERLMGGGLTRYSSTIIAGSIGTGKTFSGLNFLMEGVRHGENGLYVGFYESQEQLLNKAGNLGLDLRPAVESGRLHLMTLSPVELEPDSVATLVKEEVKRLGISRLVVDGFEVIEQVCRLEGRSQDFTAAFVNFFKAQGVTSLYTHNIGKLIGTELDLGNSPFAMLAENLILFKHVEYSNHLYRVLTILKMRDSNFDPSIRQYVIEEGKGIRVLQPFESAEGVLSGLARSLGAGVSLPETRLQPE